MLEEGAICVDVWVLNLVGGNNCYVFCRYRDTVLPEWCKMGSSRCLTVWKCGICKAENNCMCDQQLLKTTTLCWNFFILQAEELYSVVTVVDNETLSAVLDVVSNLTTLTEPTTASIFPRDLNTSNYIVTNTVDLLLLSLDQGRTTHVTAVCSLLRH